MKYVFKKVRYNILMPLVDAIGGVIFFPTKLFRKTPSNPKNILVVRLDHIGDFVCTTPLMRNLKKQYPQAKITALINSVSKDLAYRDPAIDKVITYSPAHLARDDKSSLLEGLKRVVKDVRAFNFDLGIDPRGDLLSILIMWLGGVKYRVGYGITGGGFLLNREVKYDKTIHIIDRNLTLLKELGIPADDRLPEIHFNGKDIEAVEGLPAGRQAMTEGDRISNDNFVVLHPFAGAKAKEWPHDKFQELIDRLKKDGRNILLVGAEKDEGHFANIIDLRGKLNLPQLACLIKKTGLFIGLDSGPANVAAALNVPSVVICSGTNLPQLWIPDNSNVKFVYKDIECKPCENKICPRSRHECMDRITVEDVFDKFKEIASAAKAASQ